MKKFVCVLCVVALVAGALLCFASCAPNPMERAAKNADTYTIVMSYDEQTHSVSAVQTVEMVNRSENSFGEVKFHIYANQYRQDAASCVVPNSYRALAYPNGESYGEISFDCVKVNGNAVGYTIEGEDLDILSVPVQKDWFPNDKLLVEMTYTVTLANIKHRLGWTDNTVNLGNFFPVVCHIENGCYQTTPYYNVGDPFVSDVANFAVTLKVDEDYTVAATGNLVEASSENGFATYCYTADAVRDFAFVMSKNFSKLSKTVDGITVNYYYFADDDSEASLNIATSALQFYSEKIGDYPYKQLSVCETEFCYGGMEYPQLVMITSGSRSYHDAIAHEVAHQWFYAVVGNDQIENPWMDEGLAEFLTYLFWDNAQIAKLSQNVLANIRTYTTYVDVLNNYYSDVDTTFRPVYKFKNDNEYVVMTYIKGSLMFNTLYETMGAGKFFRALAEYYNQAMFTVAPFEQMIDCFAQVGGQEIATIFRTYQQGKEILGKVTD